MIGNTTYYAVTALIGHLFNAVQDLNEEIIQYIGYNYTNGFCTSVQKIQGYFIRPIMMRFREFLNLTFYFRTNFVTIMDRLLLRLSFSIHKNLVKNPLVVARIKKTRYTDSQYSLIILAYHFAI